MPTDFVQTLTQFGTILAIVIIGIVLLAVCASGTSLGRALLPQAVTDVVSKLLPQSLITDATATDYGEFQLDVSGNTRLKKVHVHRGDGMTIAWAYDAALMFLRQVRAGIFLPVLKILSRHEPKFLRKPVPFFAVAIGDWVGADH